MEMSPLCTNTSQGDGLLGFNALRTVQSLMHSVDELHAACIKRIHERKQEIRVPVLLKHPAQGV